MFKVIKVSHKMVAKSLADCSKCIVTGQNYVQGKKPTEVDSLFPLFPGASSRQRKQRINQD